MEIEDSRLGDYAALREFTHPALEIRFIDEEKGRGVFARDAIPAGTIIMVSKAIIMTDNPTEEDVRERFRKAEETFTDEQREMYARLLKRPTNDVVGAFSTNSYMAVPNLAAHAKVGLFILPSFTNHSCLPNCGYFFNDDFMVVRTLRDLQLNSEILFSYLYGENYLNLDGRTAYLARFNFRCTCWLCKRQAGSEFIYQQLQFDYILKHVRANVEPRIVAVELMSAMQEFLKTDLPSVDGLSEALLYAVRGADQEIAARLALLACEVFEKLPEHLHPTPNKQVKLLVLAKRKCPEQEFSRLKEIVFAAELRKYGTLELLQRKFKKQLAQISGTE